MPHLAANFASSGSHAMATTMATMKGTTYCIASVRNVVGELGRHAGRESSQLAIRLRLVTAGWQPRHQSDHRAIGAMPGDGVPEQVPLHCEFAVDDPAALLGQLLDLRSAGLRYPLPMATESSYAYAQQRLRTSPADGYRKAADTWCAPSGSWGKSDENCDAALVCVYGPDAPFEVVWDQPAPPGHQWSDEEPTWFAQLAVRLWEPLMAQESVTRAR